MNKLRFLLPILASSALIGVAGAQEKAALQPVPSLTKEEFDKAKTVYFDRCGGCHGTLRKGATGKPLTPDKTRTKTIDKLADIIYNGTDAGMPGLGILSGLEAILISGADVVRHTRSPTASGDVPA